MGGLLEDADAGLIENVDETAWLKMDDTESDEAAGPRRRNPRGGVCPRRVLEREGETVRVPELPECLGPGALRCRQSADGGRGTARE